MQRDKVYCNIASLPDREASLKLTVESIINQVDYVKIMLNGYKDKPKFLDKHIKVSAVITDNKYGDAHKFHEIKDYGNAYVFCLDDDLSVEPDYVKKMIDAVNKYQGVISLHGKIMNPKPIHSYYHGFKEAYHCLSNVHEDHQVDVVGTGVCAFHTKYFTISPEDCPEKNMADVWLSLKAKKENVPMWVIAHSKKDLTYRNHDYTIYRQEHKRLDALATEIYNSQSI